MFLDEPGALPGPPTNSFTRAHQITAERRALFLQAGYPGRSFFPHEIYYLPKAGPDGVKAAERSELPTNPEMLWEILLYALPPLRDEFPETLYFDDDIVWHQQHLQKRGLIATANVVLQDKALYTNNHVSDLVQRISRRREYKTRIENRFKGWHQLLLNAVMYFAVRQNLETVHVPCAERVLALADPKRRDSIHPALFERVYDRAVNARFEAVLENGWWKIPVAENAGRVISPEPVKVPLPTPSKIICLCHDIERGLGHQDVDRRLARAADRDAPAALTRMLEMEREAGLRATYNVVGVLLGETRTEIEGNGHCLAFHSYDHHVPQGEGGKRARARWQDWLRTRRVTDPAVRKPAVCAGAPLDQLAHCRSIDYRLKGYRTPRSKLDDAPGERDLLRHNFEWLASSAYSFGFETPRLQNRIVKIPILFDDYPLYTRRMTWKEWERAALAHIEAHEFVAFGLHDCYAPYWLAHYGEFLSRIRALGEFWTLDRVAANVFLSNAI